MIPSVAPYENITDKVEGRSSSFLSSSSSSSELMKRYELYLMDVSYFSGKLESYFNFSELGYIRIEATLNELAEIKLNHCGMAQVPLVYDRKEKIWLRDSTSIILHLEKKEK